MIMLSLTQLRDTIKKYRIGTENNRFQSVRNRYFIYIYIYIYRKNFAETSKNLTTYKFENNFSDDLNNYISILSMIIEQYFKK